MVTLERMMLDSLDRLEQRLLEVAAWSRVNAYLSLADPALVLPSPAVALMEIHSLRYLGVAETLVFRSLEPLGPAGEVLLAPVVGVTAHPWRVPDVTAAARTNGPSGPPARKRFTRDVRVPLERAPESSCAPGWLWLWFEGESFLTWALDRAQVTAGGQPLPCRRPSGLVADSLAASDLVPGPIRDLLAASCENLLMVELPIDVQGGSELELVVHLADEVPLEKAPRVVANVVPVWDSLPACSPDPEDVEHVVSAALAQAVHPLQPRAAGNAWRAWSVARVSPSPDRDVPGRGSPRERLAPHDYLLAYAPLGPESEGRPVERVPLAVVLRHETRQRLDRSQQRLVVDYRITTGPDANGVPPGSEFEGIDVTGLPSADRLTGRLVTPTVCGRRGLTLETFATREPSPPPAFLRAHGPRSVADASAIVREHFGAELELVDEWDLLRARPLDAARPLRVRVRFLRRERTRSERVTVLSACTRFVQRYLAAQRLGGIVLIDDEAANGKTR